MFSVTLQSVWKNVYRQKRPWKKHIFLLFLVGAVSAPISYYLLHRFEIGIDPQNNQCLPPYRIYLVDKYDKAPVKGKPFAFVSEYIRPYGKGIKMIDGVAGDTINVTPEETTVNGFMIGEGLELAKESGHTKEELTRTGVIPEGRIWLMGRTKISFDSRYWGTIPESQILGRAYPIW
ncbi:S26 family signal peptidase [Photorhabdus luminescens]|uniref:Signal peptidase I n=1 Tax=Photorhabdus luminescens subsp. mexicana TaxID=2100167 RepID=A0A4R4IPW3_PHOLU|nr:S26 family signal peptidase [Photorhabdus luminescens]TDB42686.1 signal peptidase I [Photorhabdus luminescens subsp. mexicana]